MRVSDEAERGDARGETLWELGKLLEAHIRLEERVVFPMIEEILPEDALKEVASRLEVFMARPEPWVPTEGLSFNSWPGPGGSEGGGWD